MPVVKRVLTRKTSVLGALVIAAGGVLALGLTGSGDDPTERPDSGVGQVSPPAVLEGDYLVDTGVLAARARQARAGEEPAASAVDAVVAFAEDALRRDPAPTAVIGTRSSSGAFSEDALAAYGLSLAWGVTGRQEYARHAAGLMDAWVTTSTDTSGTCPDSGSCHTSLILSRAAPAFVFAADLLETSGELSESQRGDLREWLRTVILPAASERTNNWGDAGTLMRLVVTRYLDDDDGFAAAVDTWRRSMDRVASGGHIPEETRRKRKGIMYTQGALTYRLAAAEIAARHGVDLFSYRGANGATLRDAVDYLARYWAAPEDWPFNERVEVPAPGPLWEMAFARWGDCAYAPIVADVRPSGDAGNAAVRWTTLTHGRPLDACR